MISAIGNLDPRAARGILARMALWLDEEHNPGAAAEMPNEMQLRKAIEAELAGRFNPNLTPDELRKRLLQALDDEIDLLSEAPDAGLIIRLAMAGDVPSDLYNVRIIDNIKDYCGKNFAVEEMNIKDCVANCEFAQHFGPNPDNPGLKLISLFAKNFKSSLPERSFLLLVVGKHDGLVLDVHQAWRVYPDLVPYSVSDDLLTILKKFANVFGMEFEVAGHRAKFLSHVLTSNTGQFFQQVEVLPFMGRNSKGAKVQKPSKSLITFFSEQLTDATKIISLIVAVNLTKYVPLIDRRGWKVDG